MVTKTMLGLSFREPDADDRVYLTLPKGALVCHSGNSILVFNPATQTIREDTLVGDGEPVAYVWGYKSIDPNIGAD